MHWAKGYGMNLAEGRLLGERNEQA